MKNRRNNGTLVSLLCGLVVSGTALAQDTVPGLEDLIGVRGSSGERALEDRGYQWIRTEKSGGSSYTYWRGSESGRCITVRTHDGRYASIVTAPDFDCQQQAELASSEPTTTTERVQFAHGTSGTELTRSLTPGSSTRFVLGAKKMQDLYVRVAPKNGELSYQIFNPDDSFLLDQISSDKEYRGQLWQSGDHVVEVINRGQSVVDYNIIIGISSQ